VPFETVVKENMPFAPAVVLPLPAPLKVTLAPFAPGPVMVPQSPQLTVMNVLLSVLPPWPSVTVTVPV
jgi:hypothetical protein